MWTCIKSLGTQRLTTNLKATIGSMYMQLKTESMQVTIFSGPPAIMQIYILIGKYSMRFSFPNMPFWNDLWISAHVSEDIPVGSLEDANAALFMPSPSDRAAVRKDFLVLVANVLVQYVPCLKIFQDYVLSHIPHKFSSEMSKASEIASFRLNCYKMRLMHLLLRSNLM